MAYGGWFPHQAKTKIACMSENMLSIPGTELMPRDFRPRTSRTTAAKVSNALIQKIVSNQSGWDLKITGLVT